MKKYKLQPGDHLIYSGNSFFDRCIKIKTWSIASHIEVYAGKGKTWASRPGLGVDLYDFTEKNLVAVLRPKEKFNVKKASVWFEKHARYQKYDYKGLLCFELAVREGSTDRMFCSEMALNLDRQADFHPLEKLWSADRTAPAQFIQSPSFIYTYISQEFLDYYSITNGI